MNNENETSKKEKIISEKIKKIDALKTDLRRMLSKNEELSWTDLYKNYSYKSTSQLATALTTLRENGEIDRGRCSQEHRNREQHENCRVCYSLSGGGTIAFNHIERKLKDQNILRNKMETLRYLDMWIGNGPYDFSKLHTFDTVVIMIKLLQCVYNDNSNRLEASLTYGFLPKIIASLKLNKKEKSDVSSLLENNLTDILKEFRGKGEGALISTQGNVIACILCSQLLLGQLSLFKKIREFKKTEEMQSTEYDDISMKYAPIKYILNEVISDGNSKKLLVADLKKHRTDLIDMYALASTKDQPFLGDILSISEWKMDQNTGADSQ